MKPMKIKRPLAMLMAILMTVTGFGQAVGVQAVETGSGSPDEWAELVLYDAAARTDLDADEVVVAEDINVLKDSDYDVTDVRDGIFFDEDKVTVSYYPEKSEFNLAKAGTYDTYYVAEPYSGKTGYLIHRKVYVHEPDYQGNAISEDGADFGDEDSGDTDSEDSDSATESSGYADLEDEDSDDAAPGDTASDDADYWDADDDLDSTEDSTNQDDMPLVGEERSNKEFPLSAGEIEGIQSNTATFTINLDANQEIELIEEGVNPENGADETKEAGLDKGVVHLKGVCFV